MRKPFFIAIGLALVLGAAVSWLSATWWAGIPVFAGLSLAAISYGAANIRSGFFIDAFSKAPPGSHLIALTFDDGPDPQKTPALMQVLDKHGVKASFFLIGHKAEKEKNLTKKLVMEGHEIGNHSWSHSFWFDFWLSGNMRKDIQQAHRLLESLSGKKIRLFRPPYGVTNPPLARAVKNLGLQSVGWNIRTMDTVKGSGQEVEEKIHRLTKGGDILLFHDTTEGLPALLDRFIPAMQAKKFIFVTVSEMINHSTNEIH